MMKRRSSSSGMTVSGATSTPTQEVARMHSAMEAQRACAGTLVSATRTLNVKALADAMDVHRHGRGGVGLPSTQSQSW